jgi:glucose/arabinose dehydrogenase
MITHKRIIIIVCIGIILIAAGLFLYRDNLTSLFLKPTDSDIEKGLSIDETSVRIVADKLQTPWAIAVLPSGDLLTTERSGTLMRIADNNQSYPIAGVTETSEGGLLGIALHPDYEKNNFLYLYATYTSNGALLNRVERYVFKDDNLTPDTTILDNIPGASTHDGGAIAFGPDKKLYITTGDAGNEQSAQDTGSLSGKILRINDDGTIPEDNPFSNPVYSYGHRNPQGIAWDDKGRLWSTEHGPSGSASGRDELNLIELGQNYGWPVITGDETRQDMRSPIAQSGDTDTWAPGALAHKDGVLYFTGLRGQSLYVADISADETKPRVTLRKYFSEKYGRLRAATIRNDTLYISTSNTDGRGQPSASDDKILRISIPDNR